MNWDIIERDSDGFTAAVSMDEGVYAGVERMLNKLKLLEVDWRLEELASKTPSLAMQWLIENARLELINGDLPATLLWVRRAFLLAWSRKDIRDTLGICVDLIYEIMPETKRIDTYLFVSETMSTWTALPAVKTQARLLEYQSAGIISAINNVYKRTRQPIVRMYAHYFVLEWGVTQSLDYLMNIEFIAAYQSHKSVHAIIKDAVGGLW